METAGYIVLVIYLCGLFVWLTYRAFKVLVWLYRRWTGKLDPYLKPFKLWDDMYKVWHLLNLPVINPTLVRQSMEAAAKEGAVWDTVSWSLLDKVIEHDASAWIVKGY